MIYRRIVGQSVACVAKVALASGRSLGITKQYLLNNEAFALCSKVEQYWNIDRPRGNFVATKTSPISPTAIKAANFYGEGRKIVTVPNLGAVPD